MPTTKKQNQTCDANKPATAIKVFDEHFRQMIIKELDCNLLVEAAAGTGKTTSLVGRMLALIKQGKCKSVSNMAAVTFTRKATAELRDRFGRALSEAAKIEADEAAQARLVKALAEIDTCFIGTIHSFCARLLRERPVEALVEIGFTESDQNADNLLQLEAFKDFAAQASAELLAKLDDLDLSLDELQDGFCNFAQYPDVQEWPLPERESLQLSSAKKSLDSLVNEIAQLKTIINRQDENNELVRKFNFIWRGIKNQNPEQPELLALMRLFRSIEKPIKFDPRAFIFEAGEETTFARVYEHYLEFLEQQVKPALRDFRELRYHTIIPLFQQMQKRYDELRRQRGVLNFQDLLLKTADLLRDKPAIRQFYQERYTHLLVDEFQDTDPIQAEVMLLLTASDITQQDWRKCQPRPGSLFVVGDPKQAIYRFRRADIVTYEQVKKIILQSQGALAALTTNFRSDEKIITWVNRTFAEKMPATDNLYSPRYQDLQSGVGEGAADLVGVHQLLLAKEQSSKKEVAFANEAQTIARFIRQKIDDGATVNALIDQEINGQKMKVWAPRPVRPQDFLLLPFKKDNIGTLARTLWSYDIPCQISGGSAACESLALNALYRAVKAALQPENPIALVAALRSEFFGFSDAELFSFHQAGGQFNYREPQKSFNEEFTEAFSQLHQYALWLARLPPAAALEKIVVHSGLGALAAASEGGAMEAGALRRVLSVIHQRQKDSWSPSFIIKQLEDFINGTQLLDTINVLSGQDDAVRIMNLHQAKGLEAPVVWLCDVTGHSQHSPQFHINRLGEKTRGYLAIEKKFGQGALQLAHPSSWTPLTDKKTLSVEEKEKFWQTTESLFLQHELTRLFYVAATRAGSMLIISQRAYRPSDNYWNYFSEALLGQPQIEEQPSLVAPQRPPMNLPAEQVAQAKENIRQTWNSISQPSAKIMAAKKYALKEIAAPATNLSLSEQPITSVDDFSGEQARQLGQIVHLLLEQAMKNPEVDLRLLAKAAVQSELEEAQLESELAAEFELQARQMAEAVTSSDIWRRAQQAQRRLMEVPFTCQQNDSVSDKSPLLLRGVIDLAFYENDGWVIVDYKTDHLPAPGVQTLVEKYAAQVVFYAEKFAELSGEKVKERGLYFTRPALYICC